MKYGYFAVMGGFAVDTRDISRYAITTITTKGLIRLVEEGHINHLDVSLHDISNKSKASFISKGLVCVQVLWFVIQCIARRAAGYPIALLEVHTMVHVVCAMVMYVLWWEVSIYDIYIFLLVLII